MAGGGAHRLSRRVVETPYLPGRPMSESQRYTCCRSRAIAAVGMRTGRRQLKVATTPQSLQLGHHTSHCLSGRLLELLISG